MWSMRNTKYLVTRTVSALAALGLIAGLSACSNSSDSTGNSATNTATADKVKIVASTGLWANVVQEVVGNESLVEITGVIEGNQVDPHDFDPSAKDIAQIKDAKVVVGNGAGYDNWLTDQASAGSTVVTALPISEHEHSHSHEGEEASEHDHEHEGEEAHTHEHEDEELVNPHVWYDIATVKNFASQIAQTLNKVNPEIKADASEFTNSLDKLADRLKNLPNKKVASTESVSGYLVAETSLEDVTPKSYMEASLKESEPAAADVAAFSDLIKSKNLDILIFNPQTEDTVSKNLKDEATAAGIKVVDVYETPAQGINYLDFLTETVDKLEQATK